MDGGRQRSAWRGPIPEDRIPTGMWTHGRAIIGPRTARHPSEGTPARTDTCHMCSPSLGAHGAAASPGAGDRRLQICRKIAGAAAGNGAPRGHIFSIPISMINQNCAKTAQRYATTVDAGSSAPFPRRIPEDRHRFRPAPPPTPRADHPVNRSRVRQIAVARSLGQILDVDVCRTAAGAFDVHGVGHGRDVGPPRPAVNALPSSEQRPICRNS